MIDEHNDEMYFEAPSIPGQPLPASGAESRHRFPVSEHAATDVFQRQGRAVSRTTPA